MVCILKALIPISLLLVAQVFGAPTIYHAIEQYEGKKTGRYIVTLKAGVSSTALIQSFRMRQPAPLVTHQWENVLNGFVVRFDDHENEALQQLQASPDVESISEDGIVWITQTYTTQRNAPWALGRMSSLNAVPDWGNRSTAYNYTYDTRAGAGTDIYSLDTGVRVTHEQFGGRASWGAIFGGYQAVDGHGHGTHLAGIAIGSQFACAKRASLIAVRVLDDDGYGTLSDVIGDPSIPLDNSVVSLINSGVHVAVAAGNSFEDANMFSPGRVASAITVGAVDVTDTMSDSSNWGAGIDVFAPGQSVLSASNADDSSADVRRGGTSMAAPFVASAIAYFISVLGNTSPGNMSEWIRQYSIEGMLNGVPQGTPNRLLTNAYVCSIDAQICI